MKMKNVLSVMTVIMILVMGCTKEEVIHGVDGKDGVGSAGTAGSNGVSCTVEQTEGGIVVNCPESEPVFVYNGQNGVGITGSAGTSCSVQQQDNGALISCEDGTSALVLNGSNGADGQTVVGPSGNDGSSCTVVQNNQGALVTCTDGTYAQIVNGSDGSDGQNYVFSVVSYNLSSGNCTNIGTGYYAKKNGSDDAKFYSTSSCSSGSFVAQLGNGQDTLWLNSSKLAVLDNNNGLYVRVLGF